MATFDVMELMILARGGRSGGGELSVGWPILLLLLSCKLKKAVSLKQFLIDPSVSVCVLCGYYLRL